MKQKIMLTALLLLAAVSTATAAEWSDSIRYRGEIGMSLAGGEHTPFWLMNNRYGLSSVNKNNGYLRLGAFHDMDREKRFSWGAGVDLAVAARFSSVFVVQQLYAEARYRCLDLMVGSKEIPGFISDTDLASGNLLYAGNARPIPQIRAGIFDYAGVWGTNDWFSVKGYIAFGKFTDNRWIESWVDRDSKYTLNTLYHSKALFIKGGDSRKFPLEFEMGLEMSTEFGGESYSNGNVIKMPHGWRNWIKAVIPTKGDHTTPGGEQTNVEGNMLGSWNFALSWADKSDWSVKLYYEHFFEDHSMLWIQYPWKDGLYGIQAKFPANRWVSEAVYEFLYMKDQSGPVYWDHTPEIDEQVSGRDHYYNHYIYNGWQHWGMGIGNPLIISPLYNANRTLYFTSTRMWGHHLGFKGQPFDEVGYKILASVQKSWGTYEKPFPETKTSFNLMAEVNYTPRRFPGWKADLAFGMDAGSLIGNSYGVMLKISKTGWLFGPKNKTK